MKKFNKSRNFFKVSSRKFQKTPIIYDLEVTSVSHFCYLTFQLLQIFFSESQVQNLKKKRKKKFLSVGMWKITSTWKEQKRITNGEQRHFLGTRNRPHLEMGGDFGKKTLKKKWKSYMQGWFLEKKNKKLKILHEGISIDHFQEVPFFTNI